MHFAAQTHVDNSFGNSFEFTKNNIYGTHVLLEACKQAGTIKRFIHVSTDEVYGETSADALVGNSEGSRLLPTNPYSATKAGAEMLVMAYSQSYGIPCITTRGNNVFGPNQFPEKMIPKFMLLAMQGKPLPIHGDGSNVRSYLYCEDVAEAFDVVLHKGAVGQVYNIGTLRERRVIDVAHDICKMLNLDPEKYIEFVENRPFNDFRYFLNDQKLKALGWDERTSWEDGLRKTFEWYKQNLDYWGDVSGALLPHPRMLSSYSMEKPMPPAEQFKEVPSPSVVRGKPPLKFMIYGRTGWIGGLLGKLCDERGIAYEYGTGRLEDRRSIEEDILRIQPTHIFNAAGVTGRPNVDWCESHQVETLRANVIGVLTLCDVARNHDLLVMNYATGCIFEYDDKHPLGTGIGFTEEESANFFGSYYSKTKGMVEEMLKAYDNVCVLRVRMPISSDLSNPRNFITKISRYQKVVDIPNSMTVLDELLPISIEMAKRGLRGIYNFTNPGVISHNQILELYRDYIDPNFKWQNFTLEEQAKVIVAARSNNELDASKLKAEFPEMLDIRSSIIKYVFEPKKKNSVAAPLLIGLLLTTFAALGMTDSDLVSDPSFEQLQQSHVSSAWHLWSFAHPICQTASSSLAASATSRLDIRPPSSDAPPPYDGSCVLQLGGCDNPDRCLWGAAEQSIPTEPGRRYRLSFFFARRQPLQRALLMQVSFGGANASFSSADASSVDANGYAQGTLEVAASGDKTAVVFTVLSAENSTIVDSVSVEPIDSADAAGGPFSVLASGDASSSSSSSPSPLSLVVIIAVPVAVVAAILIAIFVMSKRRLAPAGKELSFEGGIDSTMPSTLSSKSKCVRFTFDELRRATSGFNVLRRLAAPSNTSGAYGAVFRAEAPGGLEWAVKRFHRFNWGAAGESEPSFVDEVEAIARRSHRNIVGIVGFCCAGSERLVVYHLMPHGSLRDNLLTAGNSPMPLQQRVRVAIGVAEGLAWMHSQRPRLLHRNLKPSNIMLTADGQPKIADFCFVHHGEGGRLNAVPQALNEEGYRDPATQLLAPSALTPQHTDVYSFGVILLELITGRRAVVPDPDDADNRLRITEWAVHYVHEGDVHLIADPRVFSRTFAGAFQLLGQIAADCVQEVVEQRPSMRDVRERLLAVEAEHFGDNKGMSSGVVVAGLTEVRVDGGRKD
ncbi:unnamed protein product [Closterium sp. NIES-54]